MAKKKKIVRKVKAGKNKVKKPGSRVKIGVKKVKSPARKVRKLKVKTKAATKDKLGLGLEKIGEVTHYFPHVNAAAVKLLKSGLKAGDKIYIKGHTTDFKEIVRSMQLDRVDIQEGKKGQEIGLLVKLRVRIGDSVYKI